MSPWLLLLLLAITAVTGSTSAAAAQQGDDADTAELLASEGLDWGDSVTGNATDPPAVTDVPANVTAEPPRTPIPPMPHWEPTPSPAEGQKHMETLFIVLIAVGSAAGLCVLAIVVHRVRKSRRSDIDHSVEHCMIELDEGAASDDTAYVANPDDKALD